MNELKIVARSIHDAADEHFATNWRVVRLDTPGDESDRASKQRPLKRGFGGVVLRRV